MDERYIVVSVQLGSTEAWYVLDTETNQAVDMPKEDKQWIVWRCHTRNIQHINLQYAVAWFGTVIHGKGQIGDVWGVENRIGGYNHNKRTYDYNEALSEVNRLNKV